MQPVGAEHQNRAIVLAGGGAEAAPEAVVEQRKGAGEEGQELLDIVKDDQAVGAFGEKFFQFGEEAVDGVGLGGFVEVFVEGLPVDVALTEVMASKGGPGEVFEFVGWA